MCGLRAHGALKSHDSEISRVPHFHLLEVVKVVIIVIVIIERVPPALDSDLGLALSLCSRLYQNILEVLFGDLP